MGGGRSERDVAEQRINIGPVRVSRVGMLLALAAIGLAALVGPARGRLDAGLADSGALDAVFAVARATFAGGDDADLVELHDGRSRVPLRWKATFERFAAEDRRHPPVAGGVVFVGSSSIDFWNDLPAQFPAERVVQRGLGGATIADCNRNVDRLVLPYRPRVVVFYAGDNDLAAGVAPGRVAADFTRFVDAVHRELPTTRIVFVSIKPSPLRAGLMASIRNTNALVADYVAGDRRLDFVDVFDAMLDRDARPRRELFRADGLHMTSAGYAIWRDALVTRLH